MRDWAWRHFYGRGFSWNFAGNVVKEIRRINRISNNRMWCDRKLEGLPQNLMKPNRPAGIIFFFFKWSQSRRNRKRRKYNQHINKIPCTKISRYLGFNIEKNPIEEIKWYSTVLISFYTRSFFSPIAQLLLCSVFIFTFNIPDLRIDSRYNEEKKIHRFYVSLRAIAVKSHNEIEHRYLKSNNSTKYIFVRI